MSGAVAVEALIVSHGPVAAVRDINFVARPGEVLTLLAPAAVARPRRCVPLRAWTPLQGRIMIGGRTVFGTTRGDRLPPEQRGLSMVFQSYAIWPHMTVFENVAFGLRARSIARVICRSRFSAAWIWWD
jgi:iron(III) transport system ATP-binding protein